jgi:hypothetical protein
MVVYVEGGGNSKALRTECRRGFSQFLQKAGFAGRMPRITACGGRRDAFDSFRTALENPASGDTCLLLVDSEAPVTVTSPWDHLAHRPGDQWQKPPQATDDHCHLMVQCMETWFLADRETMLVFFGQGCLESALPRNANIERVPKDDLYVALENATKDCKTKHTYGKGEHSFQLLALIDPAKVSHASPWAKRFLDTLNRLAR